ncbi:MAG: BlaI/MecI/CopY family transcriptional regulator [Sporichthyaceae bacterium]
MRRIGELEAEIMSRLWSADSPRTVRDLLTDLSPERPLAYTTVQTVMDNLRRKGFLVREPVGRAYAYRPVMTREQYTASLMGEALDASSDRSATLVAFIEALNAREAAELRAALDGRAGFRVPRRPSSRRRGGG